MDLVTCVCLTTHPKRAGYLPDALRSYRQQTHPTRELVVVNDGAPLVSRAADVRVYNLPPHPEGRRWTIGEKRNVGVRAARGAWLATWDDDDVSFPERLSAQLAFAAETGADYVLADGMYTADADLALYGDCAQPSGVCHSTALARRDAVVAAGGYDVADYLEDAGMMFRVQHLVRGSVAVMRGARWYVRRQHASNVTLDHGETGEQYAACGLRNPDTRRAADVLASVRRGPGAEDVASGRREASPQRVLVATSLSPRDPARQRACIASWTAQGARVLAVNRPDERAVSLVGAMPGMTLVDPGRDAREMAGKPVPYVCDVVRALLDRVRPGEVAAIVNSDIELDEPWPDPEGGLVFGPRRDAHAPDDPGTPARHAFDAFVFAPDAARMARVDEDSPYALGMATWDWWFPLRFVWAAQRVRRLPAIGLHHAHPEQWHDRATAYRRAFHDELLARYPGEWLWMCFDRGTSFASKLLRDIPVDDVELLRGCR